MKAQLMTDLPYHRIESPRRPPPHKCWEFFASYIAIPLMSIVLVVSLLVLFLLVKIYFSNSYMYAIQDAMDVKITNNLDDIGSLIDNRYNQFASVRAANSNRTQQLLLLRGVGHGNAGGRGSSSSGSGSGAPAKDDQTSSLQPSLPTSVPTAA